MQKARALALLLVSVGCISPAHSQGMMEGTFVRGLGAGMGAGLAGSANKGKVIHRTYESMVQAQQAMIAQTKQIEQYVATGVQIEAKKQWASAEQYFQDALKMIAKRDGPGSQKSAPVLAHLAKISQNQNKLDEAIGYQKTVVAFANAGKAQNPAAAVQAQSDLSGMYIDKGDFSNAEGVLKQSAEIVRHDRSVSPKTYSTTLRVYGEVLRKLNKEAEADSIDAELAAQAEANGTTASANPTAAPSTPAAATTPAVSVTPLAVPAESTPVSTSASVSATAGAPQAVPAETTSAATPSATVVPDGTRTSTAAVTPESAAGVSSATAVTPDASAPGTSPSSPSSPSNPSNPSNPSGALLPPPTADWPVLDSEGKVVSQQSAPQAEAPATPPANPATTIPSTPVGPGAETATTPATQPISEPAKSAPAEAAGSEKAESK